MVRPEMYQCAGCGLSWREFFPGLRCWRCGSEVLCRALFTVPACLRAWTPYPMGNGTEGSHA